MKNALGPFFPTTLHPYVRMHLGLIQLFLFLKFPVFECNPINRVTITTLITEIGYITQCLGSKIVNVSAILARY
jgi:hypothetical protein